MSTWLRTCPFLFALGWCLGVLPRGLNCQNYKGLQIQVLVVINAQGRICLFSPEPQPTFLLVFPFLESVTIDLPDVKWGKWMGRFQYQPPTLVRDPAPYLVFSYGEKKVPRSRRSCGFSLVFILGPHLFLFFKLRYNVYTATCANRKCNIQ